MIRIPTAVVAWSLVLPASALLSECLGLPASTPSLVDDESFLTGRQTLATVLEPIDVGLAELKADAVQEDNLRNQGIGQADYATDARRTVAARVGWSKPNDMSITFCPGRSTPKTCLLGRQFRTQDSNHRRTARGMVASLEPRQASSHVGLDISATRRSRPTVCRGALSDGTGGERDGREVPQMVAQVDSAAS
jgi:hypothetical protein